LVKQHKDHKRDLEQTYIIILYYWIFDQLNPSTQLKVIHIVSAATFCKGNFSW